MVNKKKDIDFLSGNELPEEFIVIVSGLFGGSITVNSRYT